MKEYSFSKEDIAKITKAQEIFEEVPQGTHSLNMINREIDWLIDIYEDNTSQQDIFE